MTIAHAVQAKRRTKNVLENMVEAEDTTFEDLTEELQILESDQIERLNSTDRLVLEDRFIWQWPQCVDDVCSNYINTPKKVAIAYDEGCLIDPSKNGGKKYLDGSRDGSISYPLNRGTRYQNKKKCTWTIKSSSPTHGIKIKFDDVDMEYDKYCGMDKIHIYRNNAKEFGGRTNKYLTRIGRICGGQDGNPEKYRRSFNDGSNKLIGYDDGTCPANPWGRKSFCKQEAFDKYYETEADEITIVFESDQSGTGLGFQLNWQMYPIKPKFIKDYANWDLWKFNNNIKQQLVDPAYGYIRNSFVSCGWHNGKRKRCPPNMIKARKNRAENRACEMSIWMEDQLRNINNFKHCAPHTISDENKLAIQDLIENTMPGDRLAIKNTVKLQYKVITDSITCSNFQHRHVYLVGQAIIKSIYGHFDKHFAETERTIRQDRNSARKTERQERQLKQRQSKRE